MSDFNTVIADFIADLKIVFPEYAEAFDAVCNTDVKAHCLAVYPERFFDIQIRIFLSHLTEQMWSFYPTLILEHYGTQKAFPTKPKSVFGNICNLY
jgi:hypothetical protein